MEGVLTTDFVVLIPNVQVNFSDYSFLFFRLLNGEGFEPPKPLPYIRPWRELCYFLVLKNHPVYSSGRHLQPPEQAGFLDILFQLLQEYSLKISALWERGY